MIRTAKGDALRQAGAGRRWPLMIAGLISLNVTIVGATVVCANLDKSFAIEPDYYKKAVEWDRAARERDRAAELGWDVGVSLAGPRKGSTRPVLRVTLARPAAAASAEKTALDGAQVQVEAFPQARSSQRFTGPAEGVGRGVYEVEGPIDRAGLWEVRIRVHRGPDSLALTRTLSVGGRANP